MLNKTALWMSECTVQTIEFVSFNRPEKPTKSEVILSKTGVSPRLFASSISSPDLTATMSRQDLFEFFSFEDDEDEDEDVEDEDEDE